MKGRAFDEPDGALAFYVNSRTGPILTRGPNPTTGIRPLTSMCAIQPGASRAKRPALYRWPGSTRSRPKCGTRASHLRGGLAVLMLAQLELVHFRRWEEPALLVCGLWICASPHVLGYAQAGQFRIWSWVLGVLIVSLAALELWQDRGKSKR